MESGVKWGSYQTGGGVGEGCGGRCRIGLLTPVSHVTFLNFKFRQYSSS